MEDVVTLQRLPFVSTRAMGGGITPPVPSVRPGHPSAIPPHGTGTSYRIFVRTWGFPIRRALQIRAGEGR